jgi:hypothetical protein
LNIDADAEAKHLTPPIPHARDPVEILMRSQIRSFEIGPDRQ